MQDTPAFEVVSDDTLRVGAKEVKLPAPFMIRWADDAQGNPVRTASVNTTFDGLVLVVTYPDPGENPDLALRNVFALDRDGNTVWQIERNYNPDDGSQGDLGYFSIFFNAATNRLEAISQCGWVVDPATGKVSSPFQTY